MCNTKIGKRGIERAETRREIRAHLLGRVARTEKKKRVRVDESKRIGCAEREVG